MLGPICWKLRSILNMGEFRSLDAFMPNRRQKKLLKPRMFGRVRSFKDYTISTGFGICSQVIGRLRPTSLICPN